MKYLLITIPLLMFCVQAQAAVTEGPLVLSADSDLFGQTGDRDEFMKSLGIGRITSSVSSPIKNLSDAAQRAANDTNNGKRFIGAKIGAVMRESAFALSDLSDIADLLDAPLGDEALIIDAQVDANNDLAGQVGRVYPPRISVDFSVFPTRENNIEWKSVKTEQLNVVLESRLNKQSGGQIKLETIDGVLCLLGTTPTEEERNIAELMVMMEPDINEVRNQIQVRPASVVSQPTQTQANTTNIRNPDYRTVPRPVLPGIQKPSTDFPTLVPLLN